MQLRAVGALPAAPFLRQYPLQIPADFVLPSREDLAFPTELVTDQKDGVGTGIAMWNYHVYRMTEAGLRQAWQGESYFYEADAQGAVKERQGFLRFVPSGFGDPSPKLVHLVGPARSGRFVENVYVFRNGAFRKR